MKETKFPFCGFPTRRRLTKTTTLSRRCPRHCSLMEDGQMEKFLIYSLSRWLKSVNLCKLAKVISSYFIFAFNLLFIRYTELLFCCFVNQRCAKNLYLKQFLKSSTRDAAFEIPPPTPCDVPPGLVLFDGIFWSGRGRTEPTSVTSPIHRGGHFR